MFKLSRIYGFAVGVAMLAFLTACQFPVGISPSSGGRLVTVTVAAAGRTLVSDWRSLATTYTVNLTGTQGTSLSSTVSAGSSAQFRSVPQGTYTIAVTAKDASDQVVATGSLANQTISGSSSLSFTVPMTASLAQTASGTGAFSFSFSVPSSASLVSLSWALYPKGTEYDNDSVAYGSFPDTPSKENRVPSRSVARAGSTTLTSGTIGATDLASGNYRLVLTFRDVDSVAAVFTEGLSIWDGRTTDRWVDAEGVAQAVRAYGADDFGSSNSRLSDLQLWANGSNLIAFSSETTLYDNLLTTASSVRVTAVGSVDTQALLYQTNQSAGSWTLVSGTSSLDITIPASPDVLEIEVKIRAPTRDIWRTYTLRVQRESVSLSANSPSLWKGAVRPLSVSNPTGESLTWSSSNTGVATVDSNGVVTQTGYGTTTITASTGSGLEDSLELSVNQLNRLAAISGASASNTLQQATLYDGYLYVGSYGLSHLSRVSTTTGVVQNVNLVDGSDQPMALNNPTGLTHDTSGNLYFTDNGNNRVWKVNVAGLNSSDTDFSRVPELLVADTGGTIAYSLDGPQGIAWVGNKLYVADTGHGQIVMVDLSNNTASVVGATPHVAQLAADSSYIYYSNYGGGGTGGIIGRLSLDGEYLDDLVTGLSHPYGLSVWGDKLYFSDPWSSYSDLSDATQSLIYQVDLTATLPVTPGQVTYSSGVFSARPDHVVADPDKGLLYTVDPLGYLDVYDPNYSN